MLAPFIALWLGAASLDQTAPVVPAPASFAALAVADDEPPRFFDLEFPGGTLRSYVVALQKATTGVNLVVPDIAADLTMPAISLKNIDVLTALSLIERTEGGLGESMTVQLERINADNDDATPTFRVQIDGAAPQPANQVVIQSLSELVASGVSATAALNAIEATVRVALGDRAPSMEITFHEPTALVIARGPEQGTEAVALVIATLRNAARASARPSEAQMEATMRTRIDAEVRQARQQFDNDMAGFRDRIASTEVEARAKVAELTATLEVARASAARERDRAGALELEVRDLGRQLQALRQPPAPANPK